MELPDARMKRAAAIAWLASAVVYVSAEAVAASAFPDYSYATNYISDLGIPTVGTYDGRPIDSPLSAVMNAGFVAHGVLFFVGALLAVRAFRHRGRAGPGRAARTLFVAAGFAHLVGSVLIGIVPGSQESATGGTIGLHVLGAGLAIVGGNVAAVAAGAGGRGLAVGYRLAAVTVGVLGLLSVLALQAGVGVLADGVWERASVYAITAFEVTSAVGLLALARPAGRRGR